MDPPPETPDSGEIFVGLFIPADLSAGDETDGGGNADRAATAAAAAELGVNFPATDVAVTDSDGGFSDETEFLRLAESLLLEVVVPAPGAADEPIVDIEARLTPSGGLLTDGASAMAAAASLGLNGFFAADLKWFSNERSSVTC